MKLFADGALGSRGARLSRPYGDGGRGVRLDSETLFEEVAQAAAEGRYQLAVHAIGDAALTDAIDVIVRHRPTRAARWRIEHVQIAPPAAMNAMAASGILGAVQPIHGAHDLPWATTLLGELLPAAYRWAELRRRGIRIGLGTDYPIETNDVIRNLIAATTRTAIDRDDRPLPGRSQRLARGAALNAYWRDAAYLAFDERWLGTLCPGHLADFSVWDTDLVSASVQRLRTARCLATVVGGSLVYLAD